ncbi:MAG: AAA family ATPase [Acetobacter sp.]|jgi:DNA transposition AAA+ family ATPase|nr:AAA family ATPase [Acetobacter sp.]MCH4060567.1 AAA family ATPase [Acetobacter sp.]MCH4087507.1 AAA family ATPase [Acetobacter sp.]MCI1294708.1 AAA family ATPase [Acetobacter sp.]MCI1321143.1 AAA family ATPase [Acetobacter sp.]
MSITDGNAAEAVNGDTHARTLRVRVQGLLEQETLSQRAAAQQADIGYSTFLAWMGDKYNGNIQSINDKIETWLNSHEKRKSVAVRQTRAPDYLETPTAQQFADVFSYAQATPDMGLITGGAGVGKTTAAQEWQKQNPNVWIMTADSSMRSPSAILRDLAVIVEAGSDRGSRLMSMIIRRVRGTRGLIIVDEAQHLTTEAIDLLRSLYDASGIGIVYMGNEPLRLRMEGMGRQSSHAQIFSRIGMRRKRDRPQVSDVRLVLEAWGINDAMVKKACRWIALQPGGLRQMNKTLNYAHMLGGGADLAGMKELATAWRDLTGGELPDFE